jgi:hypothetical protein
VYESHLVELQQALLRDGCHLPGVPNCDADDLAWAARAEASSEAAGAGAANVNNGWSRKTAEGRNAWAPSPKAKEPPWVCLRLAKAEPVGEVHVTFEKKSVPCAVQVLSEGGWKTVALLAEGAPRRAVVSVPPVFTEAVRVLFEKAGPFAPAICEMRVYAAAGTVRTD